MVGSVNDLKSHVKRLSEELMSICLMRMGSANGGAFVHSDGSRKPRFIQVRYATHTSKNNNHLYRI